MGSGFKEIALCNKYIIISGGEEPAENYGPNQGPNRVRKGVERGVSQGVNLRVERGAEKKELRGVDKGVMEERITSIIIN